MAYTQYFGSKPVSDWQANAPADTGHNFIDQINEQNSKIAGQENKYNEEYDKIGTAQDAYNQAYQGQQNYSDLYRAAKGEEGVDDAKSQYQKSLASVNATASAMNTLPSSINAGSNVVLTGAQRNAALGNQMAKYQNTMDYWTRQNAGDLSQYQTALGAAQNLAGQNMSQEQTKVNQAMTNLQTQMDMANKLYDQVLNERSIMRQIYGQMYEDEYQHMQDAIQAWAKNLDAETTRYVQEQENARNDARIAAENKSADINQYLGSGYTWNGSEWVKPEKVDTSRANFQNNLNNLYAQYMAEIDDLNKNRGNFGSYLLGDNSLFGSGFGFGKTAVQRADELKNKGFEDYLYNQAPWLQKDLREKYSDLLGYYGIGG